MNINTEEVCYLDMLRHTLLTTEEVCYLDMLRYTLLTSEYQHYYGKNKNYLLK